MKSIFKGLHIKKYYRFSDFFGYDYDVRVSSQKTIKRETILEVDLKEPPLNKGDKFYNRENDEVYIIEDVMRSSDDSMVYFTNKILSEVNDEESLEKANKLKEEYLKMQEEIKETNKNKETIEEPKLEIERKNLKWFQRLFK